MKATRNLGISLVGLLCFVCLAPAGFADVVPGEVIDKTNWQKAEGLLPEQVLDWVKEGHVALHVGELDFEVKDFRYPASPQSFETNVGQYDLDEQSVITDAGTGKEADFVEGVPFPVIEESDPKAGAKILTNEQYNKMNWGGCNEIVNTVVWVSPSGVDREVNLKMSIVNMDSWPGARSLGNPENIMRNIIFKANAPQDIAGTAFLTWRYRNEREDMNLAYVPAIRRVRRMSPANRSDAFLGADFTMDDAGGYEGKIMAFDWKLLNKTQVLAPYKTAVPEKIIKGREGEWKLGPDAERVVMGYAREDWQGAPWAPVEAVWVKRPHYMVEAFPKDPYYNAGRMHMWLDSETQLLTYKVIYDRSDKYWKTLIMVNGFFESQDKTARANNYPVHFIYDARRDHASIAHGVSKEDPGMLFAPIELNNFSLAGFQKYCR